MEKANIQLNTSLEHPVLFIEGDIIGADPEFISREIDKIENIKNKKVILDFTKTNYINSSGIAQLIQVIQRGNEKKYKIEFSGISQHFFKVFDLVGLTELVQIHKTPGDAL